MPHDLTDYDRVCGAPLLPKGGTGRIRDLDSTVAFMNSAAVAA